MEKQTKVLIAFFCVVSAIAGFFGGAIFNEKINSQKIEKKDMEVNFQTGLDADKKNLDESKANIAPSVELKNISGLIKKISVDSIEVSITNMMNFLADSSLQTRTVKISNDTRIYLLKQKDQEQFQKEMEEFQKSNDKIPQQIKEGEIPNMSEIMPSPFEKIEISISNLKEDDNVSISSNQNIVEMKEFIASEILVMDKIVFSNTKDNQTFSVSQSDPSTPAAVTPSTSTTPVPVTP